MGRGPSVTDSQRQQIIDLIDAGKGRNEICRMMGGIGAGVVSKVAKDSGRTFDRTKTAEAIRTRQIDMANRRSELEEKYLSAASMHLAATFTPKQRIIRGEVVTIPFPEAREIADLMRASTMANQSSLDLMNANRETGVQEAKSMLGGIMAMLGEEYRKAVDKDETPE